MAEQVEQSTLPSGSIVGGPFRTALESSTYTLSNLASSASGRLLQAANAAPSKRSAALLTCALSGENVSPSMLERKRARHLQLLSAPVPSSTSPALLGSRTFGSSRIDYLRGSNTYSTNSSGVKGNFCGSNSIDKINETNSISSILRSSTITGPGHTSTTDKCSNTNKDLSVRSSSAFPLPNSNYSCSAVCASHENCSISAVETAAAASSQGQQQSNSQAKVAVDSVAFRCSTRHNNVGRGAASSAAARNEQLNKQLRLAAFTSVIESYQRPPAPISDDVNSVAAVTLKEHELQQVVQPSSNSINSNGTRDIVNSGNSSNSVDSTNNLGNTDSNNSNSSTCESSNSSNSTRESSNSNKENSNSESSNDNGGSGSSSSMANNDTNDRSKSSKAIRRSSSNSSSGSKSNTNSSDSSRNNVNSGSYNNKNRNSTKNTKKSHSSNINEGNDAKGNKSCADSPLGGPNAGSNRIADSSSSNVNDATGSNTRRNNISTTIPSTFDRSRSSSSRCQAEVEGTVSVSGLVKSEATDTSETLQAKPKVTNTLLKAAKKGAREGLLLTEANIAAKIARNGDSNDIEKHQEGVTCVPLTVEDHQSCGILLLQPQAIFGPVQSRNSIVRLLVMKCECAKLIFESGFRPVTGYLTKHAEMLVAPFTPYALKNCSDTVVAQMLLMTHSVSEPERLSKHMLDVNTPLHV